MNFVKEHKLISGLVIFLTVFLLLIVILFSFLSKESGSAYGDRLKGIENVKISSDTETRIESEMKNLDKVKEVEYLSHGRLINILITVDKDMKVSKAKNYGEKVVDFLNDKELDYYDIQIFISCDDENNVYPVIGYKHKTGDKFYWTNNG